MHDRSTTGCTCTGKKVAESTLSGRILKLATLSKFEFLRVSREPPSAPTRPALGPMFLRPSRRSARPTSGLSATPVPIPTFRPERPSGMHRDADRRHRHAQRGISLTQVLSSRPWVELSAAPFRSSVCLPPRVPCVSRHIKPDHTRATIATGVCARGLGSKVDVLSLGGSPSRPARRRPGLRSAFTQHVSCASNEAPVATNRSHCGTLPPEARDSLCARAAERARRAHPGSLRESRSRRWPACRGVAWVPCAAYIPPGGRKPGARSTHRPQVVVIPRLRHLGWPRMRGLAPVRSHYARKFCRGAARPRRPNRPPRPRVAVQAMADGSPGGGRARLVGALQVGSDMYF